MTVLWEAYFSYKLEDKFRSTPHLGSLWTDKQSINIWRNKSSVEIKWLVRAFSCAYIEIWMHPREVYELFKAPQESNPRF